jgi:hypothetical protein
MTPYTLTYNIAYILTTTATAAAAAAVAVGEANDY